MSEFKVGDKVYLECEISKYDECDNTYCVDYSDYCKHPRTSDWVKDDVLYTTDDDYNEGLNEAWELAKKIILPYHLGGYTADELEDIFGKGSFTPLMNTLTVQEALAKVKAYEDECDEIKVGDVVTTRGSVFESIVTNVSGNKISRLYRDGSCDGFTYKENLVKTGKHYDSIDEFMRSADD